MLWALQEAIHTRILSRLRGEGETQASRQSAIAELCEGLATALDIIETLAESSADVSNTAAIIENGAGADGVIREAMDARDRLTALLSKHSPDAPGDAGTRAIEPSDGDKR